MRIFSQALKPLIAAFLKPLETVTTAGRPGQTASPAKQHPPLLGTTRGDSEKLTRLKSRLIMDAHHEEATRLLVTKMVSNMLPPAPTHLPNLARMQQLREQKKLDAMLPPVPTHIPQFKAGQKKGSSVRPPTPQFIYQSVSQTRGARSAGRYPASLDGRTLAPNALSRDRLSIVKTHINTTNTKIAKLEMRLARTSDPASRLRIVVERQKEQAKLMQLRSLGVKLRYLSNKAIR